MLCCLLQKQSEYFSKREWLHLWKMNESKQIFHCKKVRSQTFF